MFTWKTVKAAGTAGASEAAQGYGSAFTSVDVYTFALAGKGEADFEAFLLERARSRQNS